jgi:hypothetical protein
MADPAAGATALHTSMMAAFRREKPAKVNK